MSEVRWRFTRHDLHRLRHHVHLIPLTRGYAHKFVADNWPGLTFDRAMQAAGQAGVWCKDRSHWANLGVAPRVKELHLMDDGSARVIEFTKAEMAERDGDPDLNFRAGGVVIPGDRVVGASEEELQDIANEVLGSVRPKRRRRKK